MPETSEQLTIESTENPSMQSNAERLVNNEQHAAKESPAPLEVEERTQKLSRVLPTSRASSDSMAPAIENPRHLPVTYTKKAPQGEALPEITNKQELLNIHLFQEQCRR